MSSALLLDLLAFFGHGSPTQLGQTARTTVVWHADFLAD